MDALQEFLDDLKRHGLDQGHLLGLFNVLIGRRVARADGTVVSNGLTWRELSEAVYRLAEGLASIGIGPGDAVGIFLPMSPEVAIASHACAHLGAVQVPIFSGFAPPAIADVAIGRRRDKMGGRGGVREAEPAVVRDRRGHAVAPAAQIVA